MKKRTQRTSEKRKPNDTKRATDDSLPSLPRFNDPSGAVMLETSLDEWLPDIERAMDDYWTMVVEDHRNGKVSEDAAHMAYLSLAAAKSSLQSGFIYGFVIELITAGQVSDSTSSAMRKKLQDLHEARVAGGKARRKSIDKAEQDLEQFAIAIRPYYAKSRKLMLACKRAKKPVSTFYRLLNKVAHDKGVDRTVLQEQILEMPKSHLPENDSVVGE